MAWVANRQLPRLQLCHFRIKATLRACSSNGELNTLPYVDVTKRNEVFNGSKNLRQMLQEHVGGYRFWMEHQDQFRVINAHRAKTQAELELRTKKDSMQEVIIPIGSDLNEREKYMNFYQRVRIGKLLEDMDTLAGWVGFKFYKGPCGDQRAPFSLVTACVDRIDFKENLIQSNKDIKLTGYVSWTGQSSLEISIHIDQDDGDCWRRLADATFVMVARLLEDGTAGVVNKMKLETDEEVSMFKKGDVNKALRKRKKEESLFKIAPTAEERQLMHDMFLATLDPRKSTFQSRVKPDNAVWMEDTRLKNLIICHPQARNLYNKIFGGFLMREAFELAWANACVHMKSRPQAICIDDIVFRKPVEVGSLLYLSSQIVYTRGRYIQVRVHAEVLDPKSGHVETTNVFHFHFASGNDILDVLPNSYGEFMLYLDGRRHYPSHLLTNSYGTN